MTGAPSVRQEARAAARRFIDAFNARDIDALLGLITGDAELRTLRGEALRGQDGARTLLAVAEDADLRLVPLGGGTVEEQDAVVLVTVPVRELIGPDDIERNVEFQIRDGHVAAFAVRPMAEGG